MAKQKEPTKAEVLGIAQRLQDLYRADELGHLEEGELFGAVRELHVMARRAGFELDDNHPVQTLLETIYDEGDEDLARDMLDDVRAMEIRDRQQLAAAEASAARGRIRDTAGEILERSGTNDDELRSGMVTALARIIPAPHTADEAIETAREIERSVRGTVKSIEDTDLRASIMSALPASASPYGQIRSDQRLQEIQKNMLAETHRFSADLDSAAPTLTHAETVEAQATMREGIMAHAAGPVAAREWRLANGVEPGDGADA